MQTICTKWRWQNHTHSQSAQTMTKFQLNGRVFACLVWREMRTINCWWKCECSCLSRREGRGEGERGRERDRCGNRRTIQLSNAVLSKLISPLTKPHIFLAGQFIPMQMQFSLCRWWMATVLFLAAFVVHWNSKEQLISIKFNLDGSWFEMNN